MHCPGRIFLARLASAWFLFVGGMVPSPGMAEPEVIVISPHWDGIREETSSAFSEWHRQKYGIPAIIRWRDAGGGGSQILRFLRAEYKTAPSANIDVLYGAGVDPYRDLAHDHLLTPYDPPPGTLAQIPPELNGLELFDPAHQWFGASLSGFGIIVNERARATLGLPEVRAWSDLADPRLCGWVSGADPRDSSSVLVIDEIILQALGWEKGWALLMKMSGNTRNFLPMASASAVEVGTGDAIYGVAVDLYGHAQEGYYGAQNVAFVLPEGETVITPDCIAILKNPPHPETARHFLEFILSRDGQLLSMLPKGTPGGAKHQVINRMSTWPALYEELAGKTPIQSNPFKMHFSAHYSAELGARRRAILSALIGATMVDTHDALVQAWVALNRNEAERSSQNTERDAVEFLTPPCSEADLLALSAADWKDPIRRAALVNRWQNQALDRYHQIIARISQNRP